MTTPLLEARLVRADHIRAFHVRPAQPSGWEAAEHEDQRVVQQQHLTDWRRAERTLNRFMLEIAELRQQGWRET